MSRSSFLVVVTGAESTGKTTLAERLARHFQAPWVPEYARTYAERVNRPLTLDDVPRIAEGHLREAAKALDRGHPLVILDTDLLSTCAYSRFYYGTCADWIEQESVAHAGDFYLLADNDIPWVPDPGQRDSPVVRDAMQTALRAVLDQHALPYVLISGSEEARFRSAVQAVSRICHEAGVPVASGPTGERLPE